MENKNIDDIVCDDLFVSLFMQHTIKGKMVYAPAVGRLECGAFPNDPKGFWQENGYGILSAFKIDWNTFGGMIMHGSK